MPTPDPLLESFSVSGLVVEVTLPQLAATQNTIGSTPLAGRDAVALLRFSALRRTFFCRDQSPDEASAVPR